jgi:hypothetical protein
VLLWLVTYINDIVYIVFFPPFNEVVEHELGFVHIELPCSQESQQVVIIVLRMVNYIVILYVLLELFQSSLLVFTHISHEPTLKGKDTLKSVKDL